MVDRILLKLIERKKGLEINTSGIRQGMKESLPGKSIVARFFELGGQIVTLGSDAHAKKDIGADFSAVSDLIPDGYELVSFRKRNISD